MKIVSSIALLVSGLTSIFVLTNGSLVPLFAAPNVVIKPPVTLQVRQNQAKSLVSQLNKSQVNIVAGSDNNSEFSQSFDELKVAPLTGQDTDELGGYKYAIETKDNSVALHTATPQLRNLKAYFGLVHAYTNSDDLKVYELIVCESKKISSQRSPIKIADIAISPKGLVCPNGYRKITK
jgi:hypothetical protein